METLQLDEQPLARFDVLPGSLTVFVSQAGALTKTASLDQNGNVVTSGGGKLAQGRFYCVTATTVAQLRDRLLNLSRNEAACWGVEKTGLTEGDVVTQATLSKMTKIPVGMVARDEAHFGFAATQGWMMLDADRVPEGSTLDSLREILVSTVPELADLPMLGWGSASTFIHDAKTGACLRALTGARFYLPVADAQQIPDLGARLHARLQLAGHDLLDAGVWQGSRLDFISGVTSLRGLVQRRPGPMLWNADSPQLLDDTTLPPLSPEELTRLADRNIKVAVAGGATRAADQRGLEAPSIEELRAAVELIPNTLELFPGWPEYIRLLHAVRGAAGTEQAEDGFLAFDAWADKWEGHGARHVNSNDPVERRALWDRTRGPFTLGWPWIADLARAHGYNDADFPTEDGAIEPLPTEGERIAALTGDAEIAFLREAMTLRGNLWERWAELERAAASGDPLAGLFGPVFEAARKAPLDRQAAFRFAVRAAVASHAGWAALSQAEQDLLLNAARALLREQGTEARAPRLVTASEPLDYLIDHVLPKHSVTAMVGLPGEGKSWLGLEMAALIGGVSSQRFGDKLVVREHGPVWYFLSEDAHGFAARRRAREAVVGASPDLHLFDDVPLLAGSLGDLLRFLREAQSQRPGEHPLLLVIDIFADTMSGEDENAAATMVPVLRRARIISKLLDATVLLIHHASKARPEDARGSVAFKGALDVMNAVVQDASGIVLKPVKYKSDPLRDEIRFHIADGVLRPGSTASATEWVETYTRDAAAVALANVVWDTAKHVTASRSALYAAMQERHPEWFGKQVTRSTSSDRLTKVLNDGVGKGWVRKAGGAYAAGSIEPPPLPRVDLSEVL